MNEDGSDAGDSLEYHASGETYRVEFATEEGEPSTTIVKAIAAILGRKQDELDPLYYVVEPDALDSIVQPTVRGDHHGDVEISFTYHGFDVAVKSYGIVEIQDSRSDGPSSDAAPP